MSAVISVMWGFNQRGWKCAVVSPEAHFHRLGVKQPVKKMGLTDYFQSGQRKQDIKRQR